MANRLLITNCIEYDIRCEDALPLTNPHLTSFAVNPDRNALEICPLSPIDYGCNVDHRGSQP